MFGFLKRRFRRTDDGDLTEEISAHLAIEAAEQQASGKSRNDAEATARRNFGNATRVHENVREQCGWAPLERFLQDCRFGARLLARTPVWTAAVCLTLALTVSIGAAIFSVVYAVLLAPLPYPDAKRVVALQPLTPKSKERFNPNPALWTHWRDRLSTVQDLALIRPVVNFNLTGDGAPERLKGARVTFNLPWTLGVQPLFGRVFTEDEQLSDAKVALLSHGLWIRRFGGDPSIVGRKIQLNGEPHEVTGVMPPEFAYPDVSFEVWAPLFLPSWDLGHGYNYGFLCVGRLKPGESLARAQAELDTDMARLAREFPAAYMTGKYATGAVVQRLDESQSTAFRPTLLVLSVAVGCLLAIGCLNLAVLLIARANARTKEILVRTALGASDARLRRQLIVEAIPLAGAGGIAGLVLARWMIAWLIPFLPAGLPRIETIGLNGAVVAFSLACSVFVVLLASLLPARLSTGKHVSASLAQHSRSVASGSKVREALVAGQIAIATMLIFGTALFARSFVSLMTVNPGFAGEGVLTMHMAVSRAQYPKDPQVAAYYSRLEQRVKSIPGILDAGFVNRLPLSGVAQTGGIEFEGKESASLSAAAFMTDWRSATPGYFRAIGIPLLRGRLLRESDRADSPRVGLIDSDLARRVFGAEDPVGKRFRASAAPGVRNEAPWAEIVGVVGHVLNDSLENDVRPQVYWPETQRAQDRAALAVRTTGDPAAYTQAVIAQIRSENSDQPVYDVRTMRDWIARSMQTRTLTTSLVSLFGIASIVLACLGLYGTISYATGLRRREFGVRVALGATAAHVLGMVLSHAGRIAVIGVAAGLALCWPVARAISSFLFGVGASDPAAWMVAPVVLVIVSLIAALSPAMRAARVNPVETLQAE
jgi:putative ABC transport system permease protein